MIKPDENPIPYIELLHFPEIDFVRIAKGIGSLLVQRHSIPNTGGGPMLDREIWVQDELWN